MTADPARSLESYNPFDPAVQEDPWDYYALLRREAPVFKDPHTGLYMVSSYPLVLQAVKDWETFSNRFAAAMAPSDGPKAFDEAALEPDEQIEQGILDQPLVPVDTMLTADPPVQKRYRSLVDKAFRLKRVKSLHPRIRELAEELLAAFEGDSRVELREQFAVPLPLGVIAEQLGVPREHLPVFKKWSDGFVAQLGGMASPEEQQKAAELIFEFQRYFAKIVVDRRAAPRDDIISDMVNAADERGQPLNMAESLSILQQLLVAGNETTASTISEGARLFAEHPDAWQAIREDPSRIPNAVEEILRLATPTANMWRVTTRDTELAGVAIPQGAMVMLRYAAADRDEEVFPDPDRFDIERANASEHLAFGHGIHFCIGAQLAKAELVNAFQLLSERLRSIRIPADAPPLEHTPNILLRGLKSLPLELDWA